MLKEMLVDVARRTELGKNVSRRLRRDGMVPAVVYGMKRPAVPVAVDPKVVLGILSSESGANTVFQLRLDGKDTLRRHVMIRQYQADPVDEHLVHVDFVRVDMDQRVQVGVPLETSGVSEGVKNQDAIMDFVGRNVQVSCLPVDIPGRLVIDVTPMNLGDVFRAKDLELDEKIELISDPEQALVVIAGRAEEEVEPTAEEAVEAEAAEPTEEETKEAPAETDAEKKE